METAKETLYRITGHAGILREEIIIKAMVEFAKMHRKEALEEANLKAMDLSCDMLNKGLNTKNCDIPNTVAEYYDNEIFQSYPESKII